MTSTKAQNAQNTHSIMGIYTDYGGYWESYNSSQTPSARSGNSSVKPDLSHNMLAFKWNNTIFSTGVNDALLTSKGLSYTPSQFYAFPMSNISWPSNPGAGNVYVGLGRSQDGAITAASYSGTTPIAAPDILTKGTHGLDIGSCITNLPAQELTFNFKELYNVYQFSDAIPDIIVTQVADPSSGNQDQVYFTDASGNVVGNTLTIYQTQLSILGSWIADFFVPPNGGSAGTGFTNTQRDIRMWTAKISDFGIDASNYQNAKFLKYKLGGTSDPAFLAYNASVVAIVKANDDNAQTPINTPVDIHVLDNDIPADGTIDPSSVTVLSGYGPTKGTVTISSAGVVTYTPLTATTFGTDQFTYQISSYPAQTNGITLTSTAVVSVSIGASITPPVFASNLVSKRCQGSSTNNYSATSSNNVSMQYYLTPSSAGTIGEANGSVTWNAFYSGTATVTAIAKGVDGPKSTDFSVTVDPAPTISLYSAPGTDNQIVTSTNLFQNIVYTLTNTSVPTFTNNITGGGTTGTYDATQKQYAIAGAPSLLGNYNYTLTAAPLTGSSCSANATATGTITMLAYPLPIKWGYVRGTALTDGNILIEWSTQTEINSKSFTVESSSDGGFSFQNIGIVSAMGNSTHEVDYRLTDSSKTKGTYSYRIKETDLDGTVSYSNTIAVSISNNKTSVSLFPNPAKDYINITAAENATIVVFNATGTVMNVTQSYSSNYHHILLKGLASGEYFVRVTEGGKVSTYKFVLLH